ncbi:splicing factor U2AF 26 kDa subunit [Saimiri boliviensis]|uniref:splicing factor U2AF 26 kDa subunit n=1 Tax=Saimiri boliviensis TaxID=27679 RepID=UPI000533E83C
MPQVSLEIVVFFGRGYTARKRCWENSCRGVCGEGAHLPRRARVKIAEYLASIFGTEKDKVNCSFYLKIGACRHGDRCSRLHNKPTFSQEVFTELQEKYGEIEEMNVYDNLRNHLVGNIYVKVLAVPGLGPRGGGISMPDGRH